MALYSAHDTTLVPLLLAFDVFDHKWPHYSSSLAFELWQVILIILNVFLC